MSNLYMGQMYNDNWLNKLETGNRNKTGHALVLCYVV